MGVMEIKLMCGRQRRKQQSLPCTAPGGLRSCFRSAGGRNEPAFPPISETHQLGSWSWGTKLSSSLGAWLEHRKMLRKGRSLRRLAAPPWVLSRESPCPLPRVPEATVPRFLVLQEPMESGFLGLGSDRFPGSNTPEAVRSPARSHAQTAPLRRGSAPL